MRTTTLKITAFKKQFIFLLIILPLLITACATVAKSERYAPEWFRVLEETEDESCYLIKISTLAMEEADASENAVNALYSRIMELTGKGELFSNSEDQAVLKDEIKTFLNTELPIEDILSLHRQEWFYDKDGSYYYGAFCLYKSAAEELNDRLMERYYENDELLNAFLALSESYDSEQNYYSAAEELLRAAVHVVQQSIPLSGTIAQTYIDNAASLLARVEVSGVQAPENAFANTMIGDPFRLMCSSGDARIMDVEFLVSYVGKKEMGAKGSLREDWSVILQGLLIFITRLFPFQEKLLSFLLQVAEISILPFKASQLKGWIFPDFRTGSMNQPWSTGFQLSPCHGNSRWELCCFIRI